MTEVNEQLEEEFASIDELGIDEGDQSEEVEQETQSQVKVPKKFEGKGIDDVVNAYTELEKEFSRKNNELGELRKLADEFLQLELESKRKGKDEQQTPRKTLQVDDLLEDPETAISSAIENNPRLKQLEQELFQEKVGKAKAKFEQKHPDSQELMQTPDFQQWIMGSKVRQQMFKQADQNWDFETADELFTMYKELHGEAREESKAKAQAKRQDALKRGAAEKGGTGESRRKVFRRADLIQLRMTNPNKYNNMLPEIERAYAEGRVR